MPAISLDGKRLAQEKQQALAKTVEAWTKKYPQPHLASVLVGENPASALYVKHKQKACLEVGMLCSLIHLKNNTSAETLTDTLKELNQNPNIHGIILQLPLPLQLSPLSWTESIDPKKDVDGFHPYHLGRLLQKRPSLRPATPQGIMMLLEHYAIPLPGKHAVVIGASNIVGRPMALELLQAACTVTVCHSRTTNLSHHVSEADILVVAVGNTSIVDANWIQSGAVVVDVGIHQTPQGLRGDLDHTIAAARASYLSPVPGGVGPMTVTSLLYNTFQAAQHQQKGSMR